MSDLIQPEPTSTLNSLPTMSDLVQVIDEEYSFSETAKANVRKWGSFIKSGLDYNILSILGPQSGGKSTLLNLLFNTSFPEMNSSNRKQTTKGLWLSYDRDATCVVMDVEGTDSKERGEAHINFERKSALFSLALSEVLIVNMWANDVGRYAAAQYDTLKTVFDLNIQLFHQQNSPKTLILFCLRDHQSTPLEDLSATLLGDMKEIWEKDVQKPSHLSANQLGIENFFDFDFVSLPNYVYEKDNFLQSVSLLRKRLVKEKGNSNCLFRDEYSKRIPADGFVDYAEGLWDKIANNKDLDIPSMKEMLANIRCEEIEKEALDQIANEYTSLLRVLEKSLLVDNLMSKVDKLQTAALQFYDDGASLYQHNVYQVKREGLLQVLDEKLDLLKKLQVNNFIRKKTAAIEESLSRKLGILFNESNADMWVKTNQLYRCIVDSSQPEFDDFANSLGISNEWMNALAQTLLLQIEKQSRHQIPLLANRMVKIFEREFKFDSDSIPRQWKIDDDVTSLFKFAKNHALKVLSLYETLKIDGLKTKIVLLSEEEMTQTKYDFLGNIRPFFEEALSIQKRNAEGPGLPVWGYGLVALLGFNEFMALLSFLLDPTNFFLLLLCVLIGGGIYFLHTLNLIGPAEQVVKSAVREFSTQALQVGANLLPQEVIENVRTKKEKPE